MRYLTILMGLLLAQKPFEGTVVYVTRLEGEMAKQMGEMLRDALPQRIVFYYQRDKMRMDMGEEALIIDPTARKAYVLKPSLKTYIERDIEESEKKDENKGPEVKKTKEKTKILGYSVDKYETTMESQLGPVKLEIWATSQLRPSQPAKTPLSGSVKVEGLPLKISNSVTNIDLRFVMVATEVNTTPPAEELFQIPAGYVKEEAGAASEED